MNFAPLRFEPILQERLWGGTKLSEVLGKPIISDITGESWELSAVPGNVSIVSQGEHKGLSLQELIDTYPTDLLGKQVFDRFGHEFPILIKFIDAKQDLSIQVHPNDKLARERHNSFGKTEMWYVMDADVDANLIVGFNRDVSQKEYKTALENNALLDVLNYEGVVEGDTFFINTGKIHAIGAGVLLAEIQQTSDITYRVFDFNRRDKDGNLRELHTELALDAIDYKRKDDFRVRYPMEHNEPNKMVDCPYFKTHFLELTKDFEEDISSVDSFIIYICVDGTLSLGNEFGSIRLKKGETALVSGNSKRVSYLTDNAKLLKVTV